MTGTSWRLGAAALAGLALLDAGALVGQGTERYALRGERVAVHNLAGEVRVEAGSGSEVVVEVTRGGADAGRLRVEQDQEGGASALRVVTPGDRLVYPRMGPRSNSQLRVRRDGSFGGGIGSRQVTVRGSGSGVEAFADLRVRVPAGRTLTIHQGVGRVEAANVNGTLRIHTASAPVEVSGTRGSLGVDVGSGSVRVQDAEGEVDVDTGSGSVRLGSVRGPRVRVDTGSGSVTGVELRAATLLVDVGSGRVELRDVRTDEANVDTGSGSVQLSLAAPARSVRIDTGSGSVRLAVPPTQGAELEIDTGSGGIDVDLPAENVRVRRSHYQGRIGDGSGRIRIDTGSGGVRVTRL